MKTASRLSICIGLIITLIGTLPAYTADSLYGTITEVKSGTVVFMKFGGELHELRLIGIEVPDDSTIQEKATEFVSALVLGKSARMRFMGGAADGAFMVRLFTDDPDFGIEDVAVELVRAGWAIPNPGFEFKYGELADAEREARDSGRGIWADGRR
ncbi:MAG: thermonuclease family protein [Gammaproteobacteria bacterium]|nr:thermonuclease family protein [Gammaproteobacteria bacterium]